jgi:chemotaxis signal transduction protein
MTNTTTQYIVFSLADTFYAIPTSQIAHVEMIDEVTRVPNAPPAVDGIVFSRGAVVPAVNLRARFGFERRPYDVRTRLLVVQSAGRMVGLIVDAAREFQNIPASAIVPPNDALAASNRRYLQGIANITGRLILLLDLSQLLDEQDGVAASRADLVPATQELR